MLSQTDFALFARLRALRKQLAEREGVPAYALFTNEQLAEMVQRGVHNAAGLKEIDGVGDARIEKYGAAFLMVLKGGDEEGRTARRNRTMKRSTLDLAAIADWET